MHTEITQRVKSTSIIILLLALISGGMLTSGTAAGAITPELDTVPADQPSTLPQTTFRSSITPGEVTDSSVANGVDELDIAPQARTADAAIKWFRDRKGSTRYEGECEKAVRLAWARRTHHPSAIAHWRSSDGVRHIKDRRPPKGAFVFWNIGRYGHVGLADGKGGFWSTGVHRKIGHRPNLDHFRNYLGWKAGNSN